MDGRARRLGAVAPLVVLAAAVAAIGAGAGWYIFGRGTDEGGPPRGAEQQASPALVADDDPNLGLVEIQGRDPQDGPPVVPGPEVEVRVTAALGATEMQVGTDPTFTATPWVAVAPALTLRLDNSGHQIIFARFRSALGAPPSEPRLTDVIIDPTYVAATASAEGRHEPSWVRPLSTTAVMVRVEAGRLERGSQQPYAFESPAEGDDVDRSNRLAVVSRDGEPYGREVDGSGEFLRPYDRLLGQALDGQELADGDWSVRSLDDGGGFGPEVAPVAVERISRPSASGLGEGGERVMAMVHDIVLQLPTALAPGSTYEIVPPEDSVAPITFMWDPDETVSPSVHVNQNGYGSTDPLKVGYLSGLFDDIGALDYGEGMEFWLVDASSRERVHRGSTTARAGDGDLGRGDLTGSAVYELDFTAFDQEGRYQLCVAGVGCSELFAITEEPWLPLTVQVGRAMYHQRSGIALGPPYTTVERPRPYHPDDGMIVNAAELSMLDVTNTPPEQLFATLIESGTTVEVPDAWGGHFDAGDWDRRVQHLFWVRSVVELVEIHPEVFAELDLAIPESGDAVPDLLDEGLWTLDFFARLQGADGSIRGGVEASEHPQADATSWTDNLAVFAFAPDPWSSYLYAGVAAQMADVLEPYDQDRAKRYAASAVAAMDWADRQPPHGPDRELLGETRSVAAAALYKLTGEEGYHRIFLETTSLLDSTREFPACHFDAACDAAWIYLTTDERATDSDARAAIEAQLLARADSIVDIVDGTAFGWALEHPDVPLVWGLGVGGSPHAMALTRAYVLSGDERYRQAALRSAAVSLGANPTNTVYLTGIGRNPVRSPLIVDVWNGGLPVWAGTPVYGNHAVGLLADEAWIDDYALGPAGVTPLAKDAPYLWQWYDVADVAMFNEYTVFQSHAQALYAFGFLAGADS